MRSRTTWTALAVVALGGCTPGARGGRGVEGATPEAHVAVDAARPGLVGSWHLLWLELPGPDGALRHIADAKGSLIYMPGGQVTVQVMYASTGDTPSGGPVQYAQGGYEGSFGRYAVDEATRTVTHRYDGSNVRALLGQDLPRRYEITGARLVIRSTRADERWSVAWERDAAAAR